MKYLFAVITLLALSWPAHALDPSDSGNYAVVHRDGHITGFTFLVSLRNGRWNITQQQADGKLDNITCTRDCLLQESLASDVARFFNAIPPGEAPPSCVHNHAFAFCRQASPATPGKREYSLVALIAEQPIHVRLKRLTTLPGDARSGIIPNTNPVHPAVIR